MDSPISKKTKRIECVSKDPIEVKKTKESNELYIPFCKKTKRNEYLLEKSKRLEDIAFINPNNIELPEDSETLYSKLIPVSNGELLTKYPYSVMSKFAYTLAEEDKNEEAIKLWYNRYEEGLKQFRVYSYVNFCTCCGYFKSTLDDIIKVGKDIIRKHKIVYVTTEPCDCRGNLTFKVSDTYDGMMDMYFS